MQPLDLGLKTLFADFQESVLVRFRLEKEKPKQKIYVRKRIKNKIYWYTQINSRAQKNQQAYFGPSTPATNKMVEENRTRLRKQNTQIRQLVLLERKKISILKSAGFPEIDRKTAKLLDHFSKQNICYQTGALIGSLAYFAYPGILGATLDHESLKTDIDFARSQADPVSMTTTEELFQDFVRDLYAIPGLSNLTLPSSFIYQNEIKIDFLIPKLGKERKTYHFPGVVGLGAEAIRFLDYLLAERVEGILLSRNKAIPVTVPHPSRFALHKILVAMKRGAHERAKRNKDLHQASQLIIACANEMPETLVKAKQALLARGKKWKTLLNQGKQHLSPEAQDLI